MTPRYPGATWMPVGQDCGGNNGPLACSWHEAVTTAGKQAIAGWVGQENSCHAFIGADGDMGQYKDFDRVAYGVLNGNQRGVITIETWDDLLPATGRSPNGSHGPNDFPWTDQQVARIIDVIAWMRGALGIPIHFMGNTRERGHAPHRLGVPQADGNVDVGYGPDQWTSHPGKQCPGDMRIRQLRDHILPAAQARFDAGAGTLPQGPVDGAGGGYTPSGTDDSMSAAEVQTILDALRSRSDTGSVRSEIRYLADQELKPAIAGVQASLNRLLYGGGRADKGDRPGDQWGATAAVKADTAFLRSAVQGGYSGVTVNDNNLAGVWTMVHDLAAAVAVLNVELNALVGLVQAISDVVPPLVTYTVVVGDTLGGVAAAHGTTTDAVLAVNPQITNPDSVAVGQVIKLPAAV